MKLSIFHNSKEKADNIPYMISVNLREEVIAPRNTFIIPVHVHLDKGGTGPICSVEICGFRIESEDPDELLPASSRLLAGLINMARLPTYVFAASDSRLLYPVYTVGDEVFATTPGGPVFRDVELAKVRGYLSDYLHTMEELGTADHVETLHVRGVDRNTLGLVRPEFYLKKRVAGEAEFWAPVFLAEDGRTIYTYAASAKREVPVDEGHEILALHDLVAMALVEDHRLSDPNDLRPDRLFPSGLESMLSVLSLQPYELHFPVEVGEKTLIPLYRNGKSYVAVEHRVREDRYSVFIGYDPLDLRDRVTQDLMRRGVIEMSDNIELIYE